MRRITVVDDPVIGRCERTRCGQERSPDRSSRRQVRLDRGRYGQFGSIIVATIRRNVPILAETRSLILGLVQLRWHRHCNAQRSAFFNRIQHIFMVFC